MSGRRVLLGPRAMLHNGIHGSLMERPPTGVEYAVSPGRHRLVLRDECQSIFDGLPRMEASDFGKGDETCHAVYWPVVGRRRWITETDDIAYSVICGHYGFTDEFMTRQARPATRSESFATDLRLRTDAIIQAYAHPSCAGLLLSTTRDLDLLTGWLERAGEAGERVLRKTFVCPPAVPVAPRELVLRKWASVSPFNILFCGRWFESKNGALALDVFRACARVHPDLTLTYIGPIPQAALDGLLGVGPQFRHLTRVSRAEVLQTIERSHVLLHPSLAESVGMILLEAAAYGAAILTTRGGDMSQTSEWFPRETARLVSLSTDGTLSRAWFLDALATLCANRDAARRMAMAAYDATACGPRSVDARDRTLLALYNAPHASEPLTLESHARPGVREWSLPYEELMAQRNALAFARGAENEAVHIEIEL